MTNETVLNTVESLENEKLKQENENLKNQIMFLNTKIQVINQKLGAHVSESNDLITGNLLLQEQIKALQEPKDSQG
jgi:hypothetical protein